MGDQTIKVGYIYLFLLTILMTTELSSATEKNTSDDADVSTNF